MRGQVSGEATRAKISSLLAQLKRVCDRAFSAAASLDGAGAAVPLLGVGGAPALEDVASGSTEAAAASTPSPSELVAMAPDIGVGAFAPLPLGVSVRDVQDKVRRAIAHDCVESAAHVVAEIQRCSPADAAILGDDEVQGVFSHFLDTKAAMLTKSAEAALQGTTAWSLDKWRRLLASSVHIVASHDGARMLANVSRDVLGAGGRCISLVEKWKGDETTLRFRVSDEESSRVPLPTTASAALELRQPALSAICHPSAPSKILQSHREVLALYSTPDSDYFAIRCLFPQPLQVMGSTKQEVYYHCFRTSELPLGDLPALFQRHTRFNLSDGDSSISAFLRSVEKWDGRIAHLHQKCLIHATSNRTDDALGPSQVQSHFSSLIAFAKSLQDGNTMREFRESLRLALGARLEWTRARPRLVDAQRNSFVAKLCIPGNTRTDALRRSIVLKLFNGCWSRTDVVEHRCAGPECCASKEACLQKLLTIGTAALAACQPPDVSQGQMDWRHRVHLVAIVA